MPDDLLTRKTPPAGSGPTTIEERNPVGADSSPTAGSTVSGVHTLRKGATKATRQHVFTLGLMTLVALLLVLTVFFLRSFRNATGWVRHTDDVRFHLASALTSMTEAEAAQRTFLLLGKEDVLEPYTRAHLALTSGVRELRVLTSDNSTQRANVQTLEELVMRRFKVLEDGINVRRASGLDPVKLLMSSGTSASALSELRQLLATMETEEKRLLQERTATAARQDQLLTGTLVGLIVFASVFMGSVLWLKNRELDDRRVAAQEREQLIRALERSNHDLDQFAYVASHDLKAPLRGIANLSQWVEEDLGSSVTGEVKSHLELMRGRVRRMDALIEGILRYSRAGRPTKLEEVDVGRLLDEVLELLSAPAGMVEVTPPMPTLTTARTLLEQVFLNLIGNAMRHARVADAHVVVSAAARDDGWEFAVADNGQGIAPAYHEKVWELFQTLDAADRGEATGIGLAIVKKIVESRGGRAWVESAEGSGAIFRFSWPKTEGTQHA